MRIDYTKIGAEFTSTEREREKLLKAVDVIDGGGDGPGQWAGWLPVPMDGTPLTVAMLPGDSIKEAIKQLRLPRVSHVAISAACSPYGLYGIRAHYKGDQTVDVFIMDTGDACTPIFMRVHDLAAKERGGLAVAA